MVHIDIRKRLYRKSGTLTARICNISTQPYASEALFSMPMAEFLTLWVKCSPVGSVPLLVILGEYRPRSGLMRETFLQHLKGVSITKTEFVKIWPDADKRILR